MKWSEKTAALFAFVIGSAALCGCELTDVTAAEVYGGTLISVPSSAQSSEEITQSELDVSSSLEEPEMSGASSEIPENSSENSSEKPEISASGSSDTYKEEPKSLSDENIYYALSANEKKLVDSSLFVGDSVCLGLKSYGILGGGSVCAAGSVGARNILGSKFYYGGVSLGLEDVLRKKQPQNVFFWMGINDVNMTPASEFCANYKKVIELALSSTSAEIYVCAISPLRHSFCPKSIQELYNAEIKDYIEQNYTDRVHFIDFTAPIRKSDGDLKSYFSAGDEIHLAPEAYYALIHELCSQLGVK